ncbi:MAG: hypothetical protein HDR00_08230 [Lachnospiraceae bacterium]|nr:hypothetical protein [Lachnospiraceae bacterium]
MKKPEFIKIKCEKKEKVLKGKNIGKALCLGMALTVFVTAANSHMVMATAEEEYEESEENMLTEVVMNETGSSSKNADKEETVYLITDASGNTQETIVSDWLKNKEGLSEMEDATSLTNIENVKGEETYTQGKGGNIVWQASGSDIYYQGMTSQKAPIDIKITYYLDGQEISPENLAGKSGKATIRLDYQNNAKETAIIGGEEEEIYIPFTVISAMILPVDNFSNVEVVNGKMVSDGNRNIVVGVAMPGLKESIDPEGNLEEKETGLEIPEYVEVTADVKEFSLDMTLSVAMPDILSDFKFSDSIDLTELEDSMEELEDASTKLVDGSGSLRDGTNTLEEGTNDLKSGMNTLDNGISQYTAGVSQLTDGLNQLKSGSSTLAGGAAQLSEGVNSLVAGLSGLTGALDANIQAQSQNQAAYQAAVEADKAAVANELTAYTANVANTAANAAANAAAQVVLQEVMTAVSQGQQPDQAAIMAAVQSAVASSVPGAVQTVSSEGVQNAISTLATDSGNLGGATGALTALSTINTQADLSRLPELVQGAQSVATGAAALDAGIQSALDGANKLNGSSQALKDGSSQLVTGTGKLAEGVTELSEGAGELNEGMIQFDEEGISKLTGALDGDVSAVVDRMDAVFDAGENYSTFTKLAEGQEGRVKFIIRTGSVK